LNPIHVFPPEGRPRVELHGTAISAHTAFWQSILPFPSPHWGARRETENPCFRDFSLPKGPACSPIRIRIFSRSISLFSPSLQQRPFFFPAGPLSNIEGFCAGESGRPSPSSFLSAWAEGQRLFFFLARPFSPLKEGNNVSHLKRRASRGRFFLFFLCSVNRDEAYRTFPFSLSEILSASAWCASSVLPYSEVIFLQRSSLVFNPRSRTARAVFPFALLKVLGPSHKLLDLQGHLGRPSFPPDCRMRGRPSFVGLSPFLCVRRVAARAYIFSLSSTSEALPP